jgi:mannose-6-phosphate isomerase-like protein (cupin superfamily)
MSLPNNRAAPLKPLPSFKDLIEKVEHNGVALALIVRADFNAPGIHFFTPKEFSQQLGYMRHPPGKVIPPHYHSLKQRLVMHTQEALFLRRGKLRVDFYDDDRSYVESRVLSAGDVILLVTGGHGFEALEEIEVIEVKQGPYFGDEDKVRFDPVPSYKVRLK